MKEPLFLPAILTISLAIPAIAFANEPPTKGVDIPGEFSATVGMTTEYAFRGVSQSDENPAIQGSIDWAHVLGDGFGTYLGVWGSNVDFNDGDEANSEFDFYGGVTYEFEGWSVNVGGIYYAYPGAASRLNYDFWEAQAAVGYDFEVAALTASINYSPENFGNSGDAQYYKLAADVPLPYEFSLSGHIGRQNIDNNVAFALPDYTDWSIGVGYNIEGFDLALQYIDTNIDKTSCANGCDGRAIFSISRSF